MSTALIAGGCSTVSGFPKSAQNDDAEILANQPYLAANVRQNEEAPSDSARGGLTRQQYRDSVVFGRIAVIDVRYYQFVRALTEGQNSLSTGADLTVLILNGLGATTGGAPAKAALAAASAGVVGAKSTINTDLFYKNTMPALLAQMQANRQTVLLAIKKGLGKSVDAYGLSEALNDVQAYYIAGTLPAAVSKITANAGDELTQATKAVDLVRDETFVKNEQQTATLLDRILALTPDQALSVQAAMFPKLKTRGASLQGLMPKAPLKDGDAARRFLQEWITLDDRDAASQKQWIDALDAATKT